METQTQETQTQKAITAAIAALECNLPESIRPALRDRLEQVASLANMEGEWAGYAKANALETERQSYNGWSNRETWLVPLWWNECPVESVEADTKEEAVESLAEQLEDFFHEFHAIPLNDLPADLIGGAVSRIDWREIAEHWIDDIEVILRTEEETDDEVSA